MIVISRGGAEIDRAIEELFGRRHLDHALAGGQHRLVAPAFVQARCQLGPVVSCAAALRPVLHEHLTPQRPIATRANVSLTIMIRPLVGRGMGGLWQPFPKFGSNELLQIIGKAEAVESVHGFGFSQPAGWVEPFAKPITSVADT